MAKYLTAPVRSTEMPKGIPYIIGNEAAERFSYYGMRSILVVFMTEYLMNNAGELAPMSDSEARSWYALFSSAVYFFPILGSIISDGLFGKYRTIFWVSVIYCLGHLVLAIDDTRFGLAIGLGLIAIGSGGIKPCVSANVGDQFGETNRHLLPRVFSWFYFSINFGSTFSTLLIPILLKNVGPSAAFGLPGLLMFIATFVFWLGRRQYVHVPPAGMGFIKETFSREGLVAIVKLAGLMAFLAPFYALFDQTGSAWVLQAKNMDLEFLGMTLLPSQVHAANPILVMIFAPFFAYVVYPWVEKYFTVTALRKIAVGFVFTASSFFVVAYAEHLIVIGQRPSVWWQMGAYVIITIGEVLTTITALEFFYSQAPRRMKSLVMAIKMFSVSLGNLFTAAVNLVIANEDGSSKLTGPSYYLFFAVVMLTSAAGFVFYARRYQVVNYFQEEQPA
jgi:proton-dependent oligopeptide transporter, POT family